jgi:hypothetical protein
VSATGPLFTLALASISLIGPLAVHLFMPVIPAVKAALGLSEAHAGRRYLDRITAAQLSSTWGPRDNRSARDRAGVSLSLIFYNVWRRRAPVANSFKHDA